ncbi:hypothetical protein FHW96_000283 [Novosphingobium sp. SG751A]|uniref:hypothetical protein n=1 Tax=Novosphingobium sp. SG751A TaxID=2587000 RepID=UPI001C12C70F|nr:hypothetical protein [Novosphingobium sp. SG751A]NOW44156.1 hypothetical protein [Novosphingobium sp. SG751A]
MSGFDGDDAEYLLNRPEFLRFLFAAIQGAGILGQYAPANGQMGRDLGHFEGRRSLGFELLMLADAGQPEPLRSPEALATLDLILREALNPKPKPKDKQRDHRKPDPSLDRYAALGGDD